MITRFTRNFISLTQMQAQSFAKLQSMIEASKTEKLDTVEYFYRTLLKTLPISERGVIKFQSEQFNKMVDMVKDEQDAKIVVEAYPNFIGHYCNIPLRVQDKMMDKCIQFNHSDFVLKVLHNHKTLMYFPNPSVVDNLINHFINTLENQKLEKLSRTLKQNIFIQVSPQTVNKIFEYACDKQLDVILTQLYKLCVNRKYLLQPLQFLQIALAFYRTSTHEKFRADPVKQIEETLDQGLTEDTTLNHQDKLNLQLALGYIQLTLQKNEPALVSLATVLKQKELSNLLTEDVQKEATKQLFERLQEQLKDESFTETLGQLRDILQSKNILSESETQDDSKESPGSQ